MKKIIVLLLMLFPVAGFAFQAPISVPNGSGASVRSNMNNALQAITTQQSGATAPTITYPYQTWVDTSTVPVILKVRNGANNAWLSIGQIYDTGLKFLAAEGNGTVGGYSFALDGGQDTGMFSIADGQVDFYNNNVHTLAFTSSAFTWKGAPIPVADTNLQSGLNAELLDGNHASAFATAAQGAKADIAITTSTIASQSVNYATSAGSAGSAGNSDKLDNQHWVTILDGNITLPNGQSTVLNLYSGGFHRFYRYSVYTASGGGVVLAAVPSTDGRPCAYIQRVSAGYSDYLYIENVGTGVSNTFYYRVDVWG